MSTEDDITPVASAKRLATPARLAVFAAGLAVVMSAPALVPGAAGAPGQQAREFVIVAIGDSYAAGEGAPEMPGDYEYDPASSSWTGAPEVWTVGGGDAARRCHRSPLSGFGQAAAALREAFEPAGVEIVFRSFACAGAGVRFTVDPGFGTLGGGGLLFPYTGVPAEPGTPTVFAPQVTQARQYLEGGEESAHAVLMNVGGNDLGFARLIVLCAVEEYVAFTNRPPNPINACETNPNTSAVLQNVINPTIVSRALSRVPEGTTRRCAFLTPGAVVTRQCRPMLRASYDLLGSALRGVVRRTYRRCSATQEAEAEARAPVAPIGTAQTVSGVRCTKQGMNSIVDPLGVWSRVERVYTRLATAGAPGGIATTGRIYITTAPDLLEDERGVTCDLRPEDDLATQKVLGSEASFLRNVVRPMLNAEIGAAAVRNGWMTIAPASASRHGICAFPPATRWFNTNLDALRTQGADAVALPEPNAPLGPEPALSGGFVHPNATGYGELYVEPVARALRAQICAAFRLQPCPPLSS